MKLLWPCLNYPETKSWTASPTSASHTHTCARPHTYAHTHTHHVLTSWKSILLAYQEAADPPPPQLTGCVPSAARNCISTHPRGQRHPYLRNASQILHCEARFRHKDKSRVLGVSPFWCLCLVHRLQVIPFPVRTLCCPTSSPPVGRKAAWISEHGRTQHGKLHHVLCDCSGPL